MNRALTLAAIDARLARVEQRLAALDPALLALVGSAPMVAPILADAAALTGLSATQITSASRARHLHRARCAVAWAARQATGESLPAIGRVLGRRDHATILVSIRAADALRHRDPAFRQLTDLLLTRANERIVA